MCLVTESRSLTPGYKANKIVKKKLITYLNNIKKNQITINTTVLSLTVQYAIVSTKT